MIQCISTSSCCGCRFCAIGIGITSLVLKFLFQLGQFQGLAFRHAQPAVSRVPIRVGLQACLSSEFDLQLCLHYWHLERQNLETLGYRRLLEWQRNDLQEDLLVPKSRGKLTQHENCKALAADKMAVCADGSLYSVLRYSNSVDFVLSWHL